jgi:hypothetical protein
MANPKPTYKLVKKKPVAKPKSKAAPAKREAIKVTDPNDPRLRAFQDSSRLNSNYEKAKKLILNTKADSYKSLNDLRKKAESLNPSSSPAISPTFEGQKVYGTSETYYPKNKNISGYEIILNNYKKPVQPYKLEKKKTVAKAPVKAEAKPVAKPTSKPSPIVKEEKKMYQGRQFMDSTGLRPNFYTKSEVNAAVSKMKAKKKKM